MSVLIKGMQMPKNCSDCPVALSGKYCRINQTHTTYIKLPVRPDHCPLVQLPEHHGGLIDVDAACDDFDTVNPIYQYWIDWVKRCLRAEQVLVEAEGDRR